MAMIMVESGHVALAKAMYNEVFHLGWGTLPGSYIDPWEITEEPPLYILEEVSEDVVKGVLNGYDTLTNLPLYRIDTVTEMEGASKVVNGGFDINTNNWVGLNSTLGSVVGGESGNCLEVTKSPGSPYAYQQITGLTVGQTYKADLHIKQGSAGPETIAIGIGSDGDNMDLTSETVAVPTGWTRVTFNFIPTSTIHYFVIALPAGTGTQLFDTVSIDRIINYVKDTDWQEDLGAGTVNWSLAGAEPTTPNPYHVEYVYKNDLVTFSTLLSELGRRLATQKSYCYEDPSGFIVTNDKSWSLTVTPTRHLYLMFKFDSSDAENDIIYQLGLFLGSTPEAAVPPGKQYLEYPGEVDDEGTLFMIDNIKPFARNSYTREMFEYVITF